jgi:hypothetical protein
MQENVLNKKNIVGATLVAALTLGGIGFMASETAPNNGGQTTSTEAGTGNPDRIQAPPRPARVKPIERVVTQAPK